MTQVSRRIARIALAASTALALAGPSMAQPQGDDRPFCPPGMSRLTVAGTGESRVAPDMASIQLGVTTQAASAAEAMRQNSTRQAAVIAALTGAGIEQGDIQTSGLNLNPVMDYGEGSAPTVTGYQASNMVTVRVRDVPRLGEILDTIVAAGANEINGIAFLRDDDAGAQDDARRAAVADARHKAEVLAEAAGLTLGPVLLLRDTPSVEGPRPMMMEARAAEDSASVPIAAGEIATTATVEMQFALTGGDCRRMGDGQGRRHGHGYPGYGHGQGHGRMSPGNPPAPDGGPASDDTGDASLEAVPDSESVAPVPGDLPPPLGTATGTPGPDEPLVPMEESPDGVQPPSD